MRFSRILFGRAGLFALPLFLIIVEGCDKVHKVQTPPKAPRSKTYDCLDVNVQVDPSNGVDKKAVYVCEDNTVTWTAQPGVTFTIKFQDCPFHDCVTFSSGVPSKKALHFNELTVFKYTITVNNKPFDPHVVGGGGN